MMKIRYIKRYKMVCTFTDIPLSSKTAVFGNKTNPSSVNGNNFLSKETTENCSKNSDRNERNAIKKFPPYELGQVPLPGHFLWVPWNVRDLAVHARIKYLGFRNEIDAVVFPTFREYEACFRLMQSISSNSGFVPQATWMIAYSPAPLPPVSLNDFNVQYCATIQGIRQANELGAIQNVVVLPQFRGRGLGKALIYQCLAGFKSVGVKMVSLDATAENLKAVQMYSKLGFSITKTTYKETYLED